MHSKKWVVSQERSHGFYAYKSRKSRGRACARDVHTAFLYVREGAFDVRGPLMIPNGADVVRLRQYRNYHGHWTGHIFWTLT